MGKRNILGTGFAIVLSVVLASCSSSNDNGTGNVITNVVKSDAEAVALANGAYGPLQTVSSSFSFIIENQTDLVSSFEGTEDQPGPVVSRFEQGPNTWYPVKIFNHMYE